MPLPASKEFIVNVVVLLPPLLTGSVPVTETGIPQMIHAPITSESNWLQNPEGNIQNVPRKEIPGLIKRTGDPAAVKEARRLGSAVLYVPSSLADK